MKKSYIAVIVLILLVVGFWFLMSKSNKVEAPAGDTVSQTHTTSGTERQGLEEAPLPDATGVTLHITSQPTAEEMGLKEFTVTGQNFSFTPNMINVNKGDKVRIIFKNIAGMHDFKLDEFGIASKKSNGPYQEIIEFTANKTGSFQYYCSVGDHRAKGMVGTLTVQ